MLTPEQIADREDQLKDLDYVMHMVARWPRLGFCRATESQVIVAQLREIKDRHAAYRPEPRHD